MSRQGLPIPKGYGIMRSGGNVIASHTTTVGDRHLLNVLISFGHGPVRSITGIEINGNPAENYRGVFFEKRLGKVDHNPLLSFKQVVTENPQATKLTVEGGPFTVTGTRTDTNAIEVELLFPRGLWEGPDNKGRLTHWSVWVKVEYRESPSGDWQPVLKLRTFGS